MILQGLARESYGRSVELEVAGLEFLEDTSRVQDLRDLSEASLVGGAISGNWILEHTGVVHVDVLIIDSHLLGLRDDLIPEGVNPGVDSVVVGRILPPKGHVHQMNRAVGGIKSQSISTVTLHVIQLRHRDSLVDDHRIGPLEVDHLRNQRVEEVHDPVAKLLVELYRDRPIDLAISERVLRLQVLDIFHQGFGAGCIRDGRNASVLAENCRISNIFHIGQLRRGDIQALILQEGNVLLRLAVDGSVVDNVDESVYDLGEIVLREDSSTSPHCRTGDRVEIVLGDESKVVSTTPESPVQVRE